MLRHLSVIILTASLAAPATAQRVTLEVGERDLIDEPVVVKVAGELPGGPGQLVPVGDGEPIDSISFESDGATYLALRVPELAAGSTTTWTWTPGTGASSEPGEVGIGVARSAEGRELTIEANGQPFTGYVPFLDGSGDDGATKPYLYLVYGPDQVKMTRAYPMEDVEGERKDHPHHRSLWFTHGNVNGVDFWAERARRLGTISTLEYSAAFVPTTAILQTKNAWNGPEGETVCEDERTWLFFEDDEARVIELLVAVHALDEPVTFGDTKEGSFGIRIPTSMDVDSEPGGTITNAEGLKDSDAWGKRSPWVDYVGPVEGQTMGVAILNHPDSFRFPTAWHVRNYGLFAANPFGYSDFRIEGDGEHTIEPGDTLFLRYRVVLHEGDTEAASVADTFATFSEPLTAKVDE